MALERHLVRSFEKAVETLISFIARVSGAETSAQVLVLIVGTKRSGDIRKVSRIIWLL